MAQYGHATNIQGGVGAPVGLTVFKTAGGSLGAVPGGFDSHTPLPAFYAEFVIFVILPIGFGDFQNLCFPFGPPKLCFPSLYRKNVFYYCATFIRGHIRYQKEGILCALSIFSGDLLDILIRQAPKSKPHVLSLAVVYANCSVVSQPG